MRCQTTSRSEQARLQAYVEIDEASVDELRRIPRQVPSGRQPSAFPALPQALPDARTYVLSRFLPSPPRLTLFFSLLRSYSCHSSSPSHLHLVFHLSSSRLVDLRNPYRPRRRSGRSARRPFRPRPVTLPTSITYRIAIPYILLQRHYRPLCVVRSKEKRVDDASSRSSPLSLLRLPLFHFVSSFLRRRSNRWSRTYHLRLWPSPFPHPPLLHRAPHSNPQTLSSFTTPP
jgi:hypothetical protein